MVKYIETWLAGWAQRFPAAAAVVLSLAAIFTLAGTQVGRAPAPAAAEEPSPLLLPIMANRAPVGRGLTCADVDANWGNEWATVVAALYQLIDRQEPCGPDPLSTKLYAAHYSYGVALEGSGDPHAGVQQYLGAYRIDPFRSEARTALLRLRALPLCLPSYEPLTAGYTPTSAGPFVRVQGAGLTLGDAPYRIKGVNYYPRSAPWHRFLPDADPAVMAQELDVIRQRGFNTIRIFLWYDALFTCDPAQPIPLAPGFAKVDALLGLAAARGLKVIVTLNDLPDLEYRPLYTDWARYDTQTTFIVQRYRNEPVILAWDLRNEGDMDFGAHNPAAARFTSEQVMSWLAHTSQLVRGLDPNHLLTAGWLTDPTPTAPYVDVLSFHHWRHSDLMVERVADYRSRSDKPLLVEEFGYTAASDPGALDGQATYLRNMVTKANTIGLAGWMVWTAFDFVPQPGQPANWQHYYGIWRTDLSPKPAVAAIPMD